MVYNTNILEIFFLNHKIWWFFYYLFCLFKILVTCTSMCPNTLLYNKWKHELKTRNCVFNARFQLFADLCVWTNRCVRVYGLLTEMGCGHTALCRTSTQNWNSRLHIGFVYGLCNTTRFGFSDCHCVLQLLQRANEQ